MCEDQPNFDNTVNPFCLYKAPIFLYPFTERELYSEEYLQWMNDTDVTRTLGLFDYLKPVSKEKLVNYFNGLDPDKTIFLAIYYSDKGGGQKKDGQTFIGTLKITDMDLLAKRASIGIMIGDKSNWGKDFATRSIQLASSYIFDVLGFRKITAGYIAKNIGMERAFFKNGFEKEATLKKHLFLGGEYVDHSFVCKFRKEKI